jgi:hypothetical protein
LNGAGGYDPGTAAGQYEFKENAGRKFWMGRYSCYAIRIDANRRVYRGSSP